MTHRTHRPSTLAQGLTALGLVLLVLLLGVLAHAPGLHASLHAAQHGGPCCPEPNTDDEGSDDAGCAVSLFSQGAEGALHTGSIEAPLPVVAGAAKPRSFVAVGRPRGLLPRSQAPPRRPA